MAVAAGHRCQLQRLSISTTRLRSNSVETGTSANHIEAMGTFGTATILLHVTALDLTEQALLTLREDDPVRSQLLDNLQIARQMLAMSPPNIRATHQIFRQVRSAFPNYETTNLPLARAIKAASGAAQPRL